MVIRWAGHDVADAPDRPLRPCAARKRQSLWHEANRLDSKSGTALYDMPAGDSLERSERNLEGGQPTMNECLMIGAPIPSSAVEMAEARRGLFRNTCALDVQSALLYLERKQSNAPFTLTSQQTSSRVKARQIKTGACRAHIQYWLSVVFAGQHPLPRRLAAALSKALAFPFRCYCV